MLRNYSLQLVREPKKKKQPFQHQSFFIIVAQVSEHRAPTSLSSERVRACSRILLLAFRYASAFLTTFGYYLGRYYASFLPARPTVHPCVMFDHSATGACGIGCCAVVHGPKADTWGLPLRVPRPRIRDSPKTHTTENLPCISFAFPRQRRVYYGCHFPHIFLSERVSFFLTKHVTVFLSLPRARCPLLRSFLGSVLRAGYFGISFSVGWMSLKPTVCTLALCFVRVNE